PQAVQNGLGVATAATIGGLANKSEEPGFIDKLMQMAGLASGQNLLGALPSLAAGAPAGASGVLISRSMPMVFGSQQNQVAGLIGQRAGLGAESALGLLKMAAPLVLSYLGRQHSAGTLNANTLGSTLRSEASGLSSYLPAGLFQSAASTA